jgi:COP9 signalosome complex subunit 3
VTRYAEVFQSDSNSGLVAQVLHSQVKTSVKRLTKTFVTLSLAELANRVGLDTPAEAEKLVVRMIEQGEIHASISQKDGEEKDIIYKRTCNASGLH